MAHFADDIGQTAAINKLHRIIVHALFTAGSKHGHDMRVVQLRGSLGFDQEPLTLPWVDRSGEGKYLQSDLAPERDLHGFVDHSHASTTNLPENAIIP